MTELKKIITCLSENDTQKLAQKLSSISQQGDIFALFGTLGAGKSTFSRFFIQSLCGFEDVPSPTFTLVQIYDTKKFPIYHYDMYRLKQPEDAYELGIEESFYSGVNLIEWPEKILSLLPKDVWKVNITATIHSHIFEITTFSEEKSNRLRSLDFD